jgi:N-acetylglucosamine kinase-like BadF-type ATPase
VTPAILAVDGGNSKTDVALVDGDGRLLAAVRGPTVSHQVVGADDGASELRRLVDRAGAEAGMPPGAVRARLGVYCLAGADFPSDVRLLRRALAPQRLAAEELVLNDTFGALRAGTTRAWGIVLICGQGVNGAGVGRDGRTARFAGIGDLSGDWGGAGAVGREALAASIRARDGRGPRTSLERAVAAHFGLRTPEAVMRAMYEGRIRSSRLAELSPAVFDAAVAGDAVARSIVDRLADELATMGRALIRRLRLARTDVEVVLAGGVFATSDRLFHERVADGIHRSAPRARIARLAVPPVAGAALIGLDRRSPSGQADDGAAARLIASFRELATRRKVKGDS